MIKFLIPAVIFLCYQPCFSQGSFKKVKNVTISGDVVNAAIDRVGELYLITGANKLLKYDVNGELIASDDLPTQPDIFDPRDGSHAFLYWRELQQYELRLPDLKSITVSRKIDSAFAVAPFLVCPSGDHDIIILDSADWSLKKVGVQSNSVLFETIIFVDEIEPKNLVHIREYQNFVFILERGVGIHVFNRMGKFLRTIKNISANWFNFLGQEIYFPDNGKLRFFDLFTTEERTLTIPQRFSYALLSDERLFVVDGRELVIFNLEN